MSAHNLSREDWFAQIQALAEQHGRLDEVRDLIAWTWFFEDQTPAECYYQNFPYDTPIVEEPT